MEGQRIGKAACETTIILYFYESQEGVEPQLQKKVFERLDDE